MLTLAMRFSYSVRVADLNGSAILSTRVILLRHAESANPHVFHGAESDVDLSERGRHQAMAIAPLMAEFAPDVVVSSAMRRAVLTATPIAEACGRTLHIEPDLHERRVGPMTGTPTQGPGSWRAWPDTLARWKIGDTSFAPPGAESFDDIARRVLPVWQRLTEENANRKLVIVAHGIVIRVLLLSVLPNWGPGEWERLGPVRNVAVNEVVWTEGQWRPIRLGDAVIAD
jgi:broad specificity phosphatase PhoE